MPQTWPQRAAVLLDLDGTLVDSAPDLAGTLNDIMAERGLAPFALSEVRHLVGHGAKVLLERGLAHHGQAAGEAELAGLVEEFVARYAERIARESRPFDGAVAALEHLAKAGVRLGIVTNKRERLARQLLDTLGLTPHFGTIVGADTFPNRKPHAQPVLGALAALGADARAAVMVGDTDTDVGAARAAGIRVVAVSFGYSATPAADLGADAVIDHFNALAETARKLIADNR